MNGKGIVEEWNDCLFSSFIRFKKAFWDDYTDRAVFSKPNLGNGVIRRGIETISLSFCVYSKKYDQLSVIHDKVWCEE